MILRNWLDFGNFYCDSHVLVSMSLFVSERISHNYAACKPTVKYKTLFVYYVWCSSWIRKFKYTQSSTTIQLPLFWKVF